MLLGCIADDITGASDLALTLSASGMRTVQVMGVPDPATRFDDVDAVVVALKSRTNPAAEAVAWSLQSCDVLLAAGARQIFFKYCSTFDSTADGNIGPVADALLEKLDAPLAIACPAMPGNGRSIYQGHLFVRDQLLSDSPMRDHPLTPMRDSNLVRVLAAQSRHTVALVAYDAVERGPQAIRDGFDGAIAAGNRFAIVDAISPAHLDTIGRAIADHKLITGGSGIGLGLAQNFVDAGFMTLSPPQQSISAAPGRAAILAGSCSAATREQVAAAIAAGHPSFQIAPMRLAQSPALVDEVLAWAIDQPADRPILIYSSDTPENVSGVQNELGRQHAGELVEIAMGRLAVGLREHGVTRMIVAGGETSGAVIEALGVKAIEIGPEIDPGVPWTRETSPGGTAGAQANADAASGMVFAFKSGNFGASDFFLRAWDLVS